MALTKITTSLVAVNSLTSANIADNSIDATKIAQNNILARHIPNATALVLDGGVTIDNITIDGTEIDLSSGDLTIDVAGDIILDADGGDVILRDGGTSFLTATHSSGDAILTSNVDDKDMIFKGYDNSSLITALTLDMSDSGKATFNNAITAGSTITGQSADTIRLGSYGALGQTGSGQMTILGHNAYVDTSANNTIKAINGSWYATWIKQYYDHGITFHTTASTVSANDDLLSGTGANTHERMRIDKDGKVGIGTASPSYGLEVKSGTNNSSPYRVPIATFQSASYDQWLSITGDGSGASGGMGIQYGRGTGVPEIFITTGKVGINTTSPDADLHLYSTSDDKPHLKLEGYKNHGTNDAPIIEFYTNDETTGGINDDTVVGNINFYGDEKDGGTKELYAQIRGVAHDPGQGSSNKGKLQFRTQSAGDISGTMTIDESSVGINNDDPAAALHVKQSGSAYIRIDCGGGSSDSGFEIYQNGTRKWEIVSDDSNSDALDIRDNAGASKFTFNHDGKLIIGDTASHTTDLLQIETPSSGGGHGIQLRRNDANNDQVIGHVMFGNNTATDLAKISAKTDGDSNSGDSGALAFHTQVTSGNLTERLRLTSTGEVWCPEKGNNGDYTMYIGSCNAISNGNSYLHVNLDMPGADMFWIEVIGYDYVAKSIYGRAGGYMYNYANQTSVYSGIYTDDVDAAYMNTNGDLELAIATGYSGTSNRWGSVVLRGGHDTISATGPIKIKEYSYTANTDQVYQV